MLEVGAVEDFGIEWHSESYCSHEMVPMTATSPAGVALVPVLRPGKHRSGFDSIAGGFARNSIVKFYTVDVHPIILMLT